jgi:hypothetical protein
VILSNLNLYTGGYGVINTANEDLYLLIEEIDEKNQIVRGQRKLLKIEGDPNLPVQRPIEIKFDDILGFRGTQFVPDI